MGLALIVYTREESLNSRIQDGTFKYVKIHIKTTLGAQGMTQDESINLAGHNPDILFEDLYQAIERGDYPTWNVYVQVMEPAEAETYRWNIFDMTKVWPHVDYPLRQIGKLTLDRNVSVENISLSY